MAKTATAGELRNLSQAELKTKVVELKEELFTLRFQHASRQLENHRELRNARRRIARLRTIRRERQLAAFQEQA